MNIEKKLTDNFCCVKCRGNAANIRTVSLQSAEGFMAIISGGMRCKFYLVTCGLCGYTEMYDAHVYALQDDPVPESVPIPQ